MSLPPAFMEELRARTSLVDIVGRKVTWDLRKSNQGRGDMWAPCPFHQEKTASFHVDDRKGFYHCFGCQASGDAIKFLRETEGMGFREAVEELARAAGMTLPKEDPAAQARAAKRMQLADVMDVAVRFFRTQLAGGRAATARAYLDRRGLAADGLDRFEIGFAPPGRRALWDNLTGRDIAPGSILACGLAIAPDDGGAPFDRFRDRIMFPIRDPRGRCIAFGGRAMSAEAKAKYLNSPETDLFDKGRSLYNHGPAREAVAKGATLIVAEGYMDVIALAMAGFDGAVAPLGTAVTETQLDLLWRISPEPLIALDGDPAGLRAAMRLVDLALPRLQAGRGLRFAILPEKQDPDDLIRSRGAAAMQAALDAAEPLVSLLWRRETEGREFDSPDRRAGLDKRLGDLTAKIPDQTVRHHYRRELRDRQWQLFRPVRRAAPRSGGRAAALPVAPLSATRQSLLAGGSDTTLTELREAAILATVIATPAVLDEHADALAHLPMASAENRSLLDAVLAWHAAPDGSLRECLVCSLGPAVLENLFRRPHVALSVAVRHAGDLDVASLAVSEEIEKLTCRYGLAAELRETAEDLAGFADGGARARWRLARATEARNRAELGHLDDRGEYETGPNGARVSRDERSAFEDVIRGLGLSGTPPAAISDDN